MRAFRIKCLSLAKIEVRAVWRQEQEVSASGSNGRARRLSLVAAQIVEHDNVALDECRDQDLLDVGAEDLAVDGSIDHPRRIDAIMPQGGEEGHGLPVTLRDMRLQTLLSRTPAAQRLHIRLHPRFVDEDQTLTIDVGLSSLPPRSLSHDVRARLLRGDQRFF